MDFKKPKRKILYPKGMVMRILPRQPEWKNQGAGYVDLMVELEGEIFVLDRNIYAEERQTFHYKGYTWCTHWASPATMENE